METAEKWMDPSERRAAPVKMIWMFVTLGLMVSMLVVYILTMGGNIGRRLESLITAIAPTALLVAGAGLCLSKGSINLALPGIACMSGFLGALLLQVDEGLLFVAIIVALFAGAASGALVGLFTIQSGRKVLLVTALSSLLLGALLTAIPQAATGGNYLSGMSGFRDATLIISILFFLLAVVVCILGGLGKPASTNSNDSAPQPGGGSRFVWSLIAGALAGLAGILNVARLGTFSPSSFSGYNEWTIVPALLIAGAMIPNLRRSKGEGICGGLALVFSVVIFNILTNLIYMGRIETLGARIIQAVISILFLIPNLLIGKKKNGTL